MPPSNHANLLVYRELISARVYNVGEEESVEHAYIVLVLSVRKVTWLPLKRTWSTVWIKVCAMNIAAEVEISTTARNIRGGAKKRPKGCLDRATKRRKTQGDKENADVEPKKKSKRKSPTLTQKSQRAIVQAIQQVATSDLVAAVLGRSRWSAAYRYVQR